MMVSLKSAFAHITPDPALYAEPLGRLREQMQSSRRAYHTAAHVEAVLGHLFAWTGEEPSLPLIAAALYHDAIYDPTRGDNELQSAVLCHDELLALLVPVASILLAANLILVTAHHQPRAQNPEEVLLTDADLFILGSEPGTYAVYVQAIRTEYQHVPEDAWRSGRRAVLERFLQRERIYHGDWPGRAEHEAQARINLAAEIASLS